MRDNRQAVLGLVIEKDYIIIVISTGHIVLNGSSVIKLDV